MNIFILHLNTKLCAIYHCDKHVVKMILEYVQLLYTACWYVWYEYDNNIMIEDRSEKITYKVTMKPIPNWILNAPKTKSGSIGYRPTHINHPCAIWTRESLDNYLYLCQLGLDLCEEYTYRYKKTHTCEQHLIWLKNNPPPIPKNGLTKMRLAMPDKYKTEEDDPVTCYRNFYIGDKKKFAKWLCRDIPYWFDNSNQQLTLKKKPIKLTLKKKPIKLTFKKKPSPPLF